MKFFMLVQQLSCSTRDAAARHDKSVFFFKECAEDSHTGPKRTPFVCGAAALQLVGE
jgi:hypothetical protein